MFEKILQTFIHEGTIFQIVKYIPEGSERNTQLPTMRLLSEWGISAVLDGSDILDVRVALEEIIKKRKEQIERIKKNITPDDAVWEGILELLQNGCSHLGAKRICGECKQGTYRAGVVWKRLSKKGQKCLVDGKEGTDEPGYTELINSTPMLAVFAPKFWKRTLAGVVVKEYARRYCVRHNGSETEDR